MENNPQAPQASQPNSQSNAALIDTEHVWISKEEYVHLRKVADMANPAFGSSQVATTAVVAPSPRKNALTYATGAGVLLIFVAMSFSTPSYITMPMVLVLAFFIVMAVVSLFKTQPQGGPAATTSKLASSAGKIVIGLITALIAIAVAPIILFFIFIMLLASTGQSAGS